jgi:hypothetical protein
VPNFAITCTGFCTGFLNGELKEEIYMRLPDRYAPNDGSVCMIKRSIYGLRQAPRAWHTKFAADLATLGYALYPNTRKVYSGVTRTISKCFCLSMSMIFFYVFRRMMLSSMLRLALKLTLFTCSDVTPIDVSDVQQMSQMPDLSGA